MKFFRKRRANKIYDVLVQECGAKESDRQHFIDSYLKGDMQEYRFQGNLGHWSKLYINGRELGVGCDMDYMPSVRQGILVRANARLGKL